MTKKGMKPKILLIFTFSISHQVALVWGFLSWFGAFVCFIFLSCVSSPPSKHQGRFCNEIFQLDNISYL